MANDAPSTWHMGLAMKRWLLGERVTIFELRGIACALCNSGTHCSAIVQHVLVVLFYVWRIEKQ